MSKNSVLPQGFDRFFDNAYCGSDSQPDECAPKSDGGKLEADPQSGALPAGSDQGLEPEDEEENTNPGSSASSSSAPNKEPGNKGNGASSR